MANYNVHGFGGVKFEYGSLTAEFPYGFGSVDWRQLYRDNQNANYKIYRKFLGYRPFVSCKLISAETNSYVQIQNLINIINTAGMNSLGITIYPEWSESNVGNLSLTGMLYSNDFMLEDKVKREGVQGLVVEFKADELRENIPNFANDGDYNWIDGLGNTIIDGSGNTLVWR